MNEINKTMYIPLYGKAMTSRQGIILKDTKAEEIWDNVIIDLGRKSRSKWLRYFMSMRARVFDDWTRMQVSHDTDAVVIHVGCGLDSRVLRVQCANTWYDVDMADVIAVRQEYYEESPIYHMIEGDISEPIFLDNIGDFSRAVVVIEGVSMYVNSLVLGAFFMALEKKFDKVSILMDVYTKFGAKVSKYKNPIKDVGVAKAYGIDSPIIPVNNTDIRYLAEHSMTPQNLIDELSGMDRFIFRTMFAGKFAHKIYRLYEYRK